MLTSLSKLLLLCALVCYCRAGEEQMFQSHQGPFKPVSPVPLSPQISQIMSALQSSQMPFNPYASSMAMKMMMGNDDSISFMKVGDMPEISRVMCSCETSLEVEKCLAGATDSEKKIENFEEIKSITKKLERMLNKHVFKSVIVKRSVEQLEETAGKELVVANGKDAKHDIELMLNIYDNIKNMLDIHSDKDVQAFKSKLMSMPEKQMSLRELIGELKSASSSPKSETCEHEEHTIECTPGTQLKIIKAAVSNKNKFACPAMIRKASSLKSTTDTESCYEEEMTTKLMNATCGGRQECTVSVHRDFLNICKCAEQKYLEVTYTCEAAKPEDAHKLSRSKRTLHYRNKPKQEQRDRLMRSGGLLGGIGGLYDYGLYGYGYGLPFYDYGLYGYGYGLPFYDYGLYGYGYGLPFYDYYGYGYGYGMPFVGAFTYDYENGGYGGKGGYGGQAKGGYGGKGGKGKGGYGGNGGKASYGSGSTQ